MNETIYLIYFKQTELNLSTKNKSLHFYTLIKLKLN